METISNRKHGPLEVREVDGTVTGVGGLSLFYRAWEVEGARAGLMIVHGLAEHSGRYVDFARSMAGYGVNVYALDLRGHGLSDGRRGYVHRFDFLLQDVDRFRREVEGGLEEELPLFILGHSLGGLIVARYIEEYETDLRGAVLTSPWLATAVPIPRWKVLMAGFLNKFLPALPLNAGIDDASLSHDPLVVTRYRDDPLVHGKITPRLFAESSMAMGLVMQRGDRIRMPLLLILAGDDRLVDTKKSEAFARSLQAKDVTIRVLDDYFHEVLNDHDRELAYDAIREWIFART